MEATYNLKSFLYNDCNDIWGLLYNDCNDMEHMGNCVPPSGFPQVSRRLSLVGQLSWAARLLKLLLKFKSELSELPGPSLPRKGDDCLNVKVSRRLLLSRTQIVFSGSAELSRKVALVVPSIHSLGELKVML